MSHSKPHVRAYMLEHRAAVEQQLVQQEADLSRLPRLPRQAVGQAVEGLRRLSLDREKVLDRLWEIANLSPDMTRGSIHGQVKALSMIIAMQNFIPDRHAVSSQKKSAPAHPQIAPGSPAPASRWAAEAPPNHRPSQSFANRISSSQAPPPYVPLFNSVPDLGVPFSTIKNPFVHPR